MTDETPPRNPPPTFVDGADRCVNCGAALSGEQRYCVSCGERRGKPRFTLAPSEAAAEAPTTVTPPPAKVPRSSSPATVVAGVGTLLLAMGVGVLIGHNTASTPKQLAAASPTVVTVGGAGAGAGATTAAASAGSGARSGAGRSPGKSRGHRNAQKNSSKPTAQQAAKASSAASKVLGSSQKNLPPATVTVGQKGHGPGFNKKSGKFDGSFFGQ
ncbi:MAG: hypothetical protein JOZ07_09345 [Solirubrobacterales bacterium]|nr:hypothetical protein [Solirubrobacterales bacterium]